MARHELKIDEEALRDLLSGYARKVMPACDVLEVYLICGSEHEELVEEDGGRLGVRIVVDH